MASLNLVFSTEIRLLEFIIEYMFSALILGESETDSLTYLATLRFEN